MLHGERVVLAPLRPEDSAQLFDWINDRELANLSAPFEPVDEESHRRWFEQITARDDVKIFGIRLREDDRLIGSCQLREIDLGARRCELQIRIGDRTAWDRGYGSEAVELLVRHAFANLGLARVSLEVFATNRRAISAYEKVGFDRREMKKGGAVIEGSPVDVVVMEIEARDGA